MRTAIHSLRSVASRLGPALAAIVLAGTFAGRVRDALRRSGPAADRAASRTVLPSLFERHPEATRAPRRGVGLHSVPIEQIVGTMRHPSQNTADFLPLPRLRGENWRARWQRITRAMDRLELLPPVDLVQVGDEYYVADGHNRVAAARRAGAVEIDADVTQLVVPGVEPARHAHLDAGALIGSQSVRQAAAGRMSRTVAQPAPETTISRQDLARNEALMGEDHPEDHATDDRGQHREGHASDPEDPGRP